MAGLLTVTGEVCLCKIYGGQGVVSKIRNVLYYVKVMNFYECFLAEESYDIYICFWMNGLLLS